MPLKASAEGFDSSDEENGIKINDETATSPLVDWITISDPDSIIPPKSSRAFSIDVAIPEKVDLGGYYAVIFFTPVLTNINLDNQNQVSARIGVLALANIGIQDEKNKSEILNFDFDQKLYQKNPLNLTVRIKNTSLNFFSATPLLSVKPLFGKAETFYFAEKTILPGKVRRWNQSISLKNLSGGIYTAKLSVSTEKGNYIYSNTYIFGFPVKKFILYSIPIIIVLYSLVYRKRVIKAINLLLKDK